MDAHYWDSVAQKTNGHHLEAHIACYKKQEHIDLFSKWCDDLRGKRILKTDLFEEAFGADSFVPWLSSHQGAEIIGLDISSAVVEKARSNMAMKNVTCVVSDVCKTPFEDKSFDVIISNSTIDNMEKDDHQRALKELGRLLKPSGQLILTLDNAHNPLYVTGYYISKFLKLSTYYQDKCFTVAAAKALIAQADLTIQDTTAIVHIPTPFNKISRFLTKPIINKCISFFARLGGKRSKYLTGWFLAFKVINK